MMGFDIAKNFEKDAATLNIFHENFADLVYKNTFNAWGFIPLKTQ